LGKQRVLNKIGSDKVNEWMDVLKGAKGVSLYNLKNAYKTGHENGQRECMLYA